MKTMYILATLFLAFTGMSLTNSTTRPALGEKSAIMQVSLLSGETCGVISLGNYKIDVSSGKNMEIPKDKLLESIKNGLSFSGSSKCPGVYKIVDLKMTIDAERDVTYQYDHAFVVQMQSMETYMLVRYLNDAEKLNFSNIKVKNSAGDVITVPDVTVVVK